MKKLPYFYLLVFALQFQISAYSQASEWLLGKWNGSTNIPGSSGGENFILTLTIESLNNDVFVGNINQSLPADPLTRIETSVAGKLYKDHLMSKLKEVLYFQDPSFGHWVKHCNLCDSTRLSLSIKKDSLVLQADLSCSFYLCSATTYYSKALSSLDSSQIKSLEKFIEDSRIKTLIASFKECFKSTNPSPNTFKNIIHYDSKPQRKILDLLPTYQNREIGILRCFKIESDSVELNLLDMGEIDNDTITVIFNGRIIINKLRLTDKAYKIKLPLSGFDQNQLIVWADNIGDLPPNTCLAQLVYENKVEEIFVASDFRKSGSIIISNYN